MFKDFDAWNKCKKFLDRGKKPVYAHPREVWWCSLGLNVGAEINGKNENFERPVLVVRVYNKETLFVFPITSKERVDPFHCEVSGASQHVWVKLTQARVISNQRLLRKVDTLSEEDFKRVLAAFKKFI